MKKFFIKANLAQLQRHHKVFFGPFLKKDNWDFHCRKNDDQKSYTIFLAEQQFILITIFGLADFKVGHLYCRICVGIEVSNLHRILCNKFISKVSESWIESEFQHKFDTNPTVDDQP